MIFRRRDNRRAFICSIVTTSSRYLHSLPVAVECKILDAVAAV